MHQIAPIFSHILMYQLCTAFCCTGLLELMEKIIIVIICEKGPCIWDFSSFCTFFYYPCFGFTTVVVANEGLGLIEPGLPGTYGFTLHTSHPKDAVEHLLI